MHFIRAQTSAYNDTCYTMKDDTHNLLFIMKDNFPIVIGHTCPKNNCVLYELTYDQIKYVEDELKIKYEYKNIRNSLSLSNIVNFNLQGTPEDEANILIKIKELKDKEEKRLNDLRELIYKDAIEKEAMRRIQKEKADKIEAEKEAIRQKQLQEEMERLEQESKEKLEQERLEQESKEKLEQERLEQARLAKEEAERESLEQEHLAKEEAERERLHTKSVRKTLKKIMQEKQARNIETLIAELEQSRIEMEEQAKILDVLLPDYKEVLQRRLDARFKNSQKTIGDIEPVHSVEPVDSGSLNQLYIPSIPTLPTLP